MPLSPLLLLSLKLASRSLSLGEVRQRRRYDDDVHCGAWTLTPESFRSVVPCRVERQLFCLILVVFSRSLAFLTTSLTLPTLSRQIYRDVGKLQNLFRGDGFS